VDGELKLAKICTEKYFRVEKGAVGGREQFETSESECRKGVRMYDLIPNDGAELVERGRHVLEKAGESSREALHLGGPRA
jgi:hypothetical protein